VYEELLNSIFDNSNLHRKGFTIFVKVVYDRFEWCMKNCSGVIQFKVEGRGSEKAFKEKSTTFQGVCYKYSSIFSI